MQAPNRIAHRFFVIFSNIAVPALYILAVLTFILGLQIPQGPIFSDLVPSFAISSVSVLAILTTFLALIWLLIYRGTTAQKEGLRVWTVLFGLVFCVNATVFNGFVLRHMASHPGGETVRSYGEAIIHFASRQEGWVIWAQFWPLIPVGLFATYWLKDRAAKSANHTDTLA